MNEDHNYELIAKDIEASLDNLYAQASIYAKSIIGSSIPENSKYYIKAQSAIASNHLIDLIKRKHG